MTGFTVWRPTPGTILGVVAVAIATVALIFAASDRAKGGGGSPNFRYVESREINLPDGAVTTARVECRRREAAVSGGYRVIGGFPRTIPIQFDQVSSREWNVQLYNPGDASGPTRVIASVLCFSE